MTIESRDIIERLDEWALEASDKLRVEEWTPSVRDRLVADLQEAIATIKALRSIAGKAYPTGGLAEIKQSLREQSPSS